MRTNAVAGRFCLLAFLAGLSLSFGSVMAGTPLEPEVTFAAPGSDLTDYELDDDGTAITVTGSGTDTYTLSGLISGAGNLIKDGTGTLSLTNTENTFTGGVIVTQGTLQVAGVWNTDMYSYNPDSLLNAVSGTDSELKSDNPLTIGLNGTGALTLTNGGKATTGRSIIVGYQSSSTGVVTASGGAALTGANISIGHNGTGVLNLSDSATGTADGFIMIADNSNSNGLVTVSGAGSLLSTECLFVGYYGAGTLNILDGAKVVANGNNETKEFIDVAMMQGSTGKVMIGAGSELKTFGALRGYPNRSMINFYRIQLSPV